MANANTTRTRHGVTVVTDFLHWWGGELRRAVPAVVTKLLSGEVAEIHVEIAGDRATLGLTARAGSRSLGSCELLTGAEQQLAEYAATIREHLPERVQVAVHLPADRVLVQNLALPLATEANLDNVFRFEIDRFTPFRQDQVRSAYQVTGRYPEKDQIRVRLAVAPADYIERIRAGLARIDLTATAIYPPLDARAGERPGSGWNMLPAAQRPVAAPLLDKTNQGLLVALAALLVVALGLPLYWQHAQLAALQDRTATLQRATAQTAARLQEWRTRRDARDALLAHRAATPDRLRIVRDLTGLLPDNTWVTRLELNANGSVTIQGESNKASDLVAILERYPLFRNVTFAAAVSRNPVSNMERFELKLALTEGVQP
ncbi:MAG: PilN domain-containing protein [Gammaproteobacteria bacterium]|nr:PilN domain-containing protein [Gammaproteobacteria bacterium]